MSFEAWRRLTSAAVLAAVLCASHATGAEHKLPVRLLITESGLEEGLLKGEHREIWRYLKDAFPDDFRHFVRESTVRINNAAGGGGADAVSKNSLELISSLRQKYAEYAKLAGDDELADQVSRQLALFSAMYADDPLACAAVAAGGGSAALAVPEFAKRHEVARDEVALSWLRAAKSGIDNPVRREPPTTADWGSLAATLSAAGATAEDFALMRSPDPTDPSTCPAAIRLLRAYNADTEASDRIRAFIMGN